MKSRIFKSWKSTTLAIVIAAAVYYLIVKQIVTLDSITGFITTGVGAIVTLWGLFRKDKKVKLEEEYRKKASQMTPEQLADETEKLLRK